MADTHIKCPNCGYQIPVSEALSAQIREELSASFKAEGEERLKRAVAEAEQRARGALDIELADLKAQIAERARQAQDGAARELELRRKARALEEEQRLQADRIRAEIEARMDKEQAERIAQASAASAGKGEKMELLYQYLSGDELRHRVEAIVEAFSAMQGQIQRERRAMEKQWAEREKQIQRVIGGTSAMYGALQGIVGGALAEHAKGGTAEKRICVPIKINLGTQRFCCGTILRCTHPGPILLPENPSKTTRKRMI